MKKVYLLLFILFSFLALPNLANYCKSFAPYAFDNQILLSWQYSAVLGQFPNRDIFYPYGFLSFFKDTNILFAIIYFFLSPLYLVSFFTAFLLIFKRIKYALFSTVTLFLFVFKFSGFENFQRYGTSIIYSFITSLVFYHKKNTNYLIYIATLGFISGLILFFYNDQGLYSIATFAIISLFDLFFSRIKLIRFIKTLFSYAFGLFLSGFGFAVFLISNNSLNAYLDSFIDLSDLEKFAKAPFFHGGLNLDNIFVLTMIFVTIFYLCINLLRKKEFSLANYFQVGIVFATLILEQKNIIRTIDGQLTFIGLVMVVLLMAEIRNKFIKSIKFDKKYLYFLIIIYLIILFVPFKKLSLVGVGGNCSDRFNIKDARFLEFKKDFDKRYKNRPLIFSFPGDTIFYVLFNQKLPFYPTSFEATSFKAQEEMISYIIENKIEYVIYNYKNLAIQDEVPNVVRSPILLKYILNNYSADSIIGDFLIFKKNNTNDFTKNDLINKLPKFKKSLLDIDLGNIVKSEGLYKYQYLNSKNSKIVIEGSQEKINSYLMENKINSTELFLVLKSNNNKTVGKIEINTDDGIGTSISFKNCRINAICIIDLARVPLFFNNKLIGSVRFDNSNILSLYQLKPEVSRYFW